MVTINESKILRAKRKIEAVRSFLILAIPPVVGALFGAMASSGACALPMDDAYILRRYAVNLALGNGWGFNPGELSFGSTSLTFPVIIAFIFRIFSTLNFNHVAYLLGEFSFIGLIAVVEWLIWRETRRVFLAFLGGMLLGMSPMGYMNAVSGMESMTFAFGLIGVIALYRSNGMKQPLLLGLLSSLVFLTRPEGLYLAAALPGADFLMDLRRGERKGALKYALFFIGFSLLSIPYIAVLHSVTHGWLPTTYAGKIISTDPNMHRAGPVTDIVLGLDYIFKGHWRSMASYGVIGAVIWAAAAACAAVIFAGFWKNARPLFSDVGKIEWALFTVLVMIGCYFAQKRGIRFYAAIPFLAAGYLWIRMLLRLAGETTQPGESDNNYISAQIVLMGLMLFPFAYGALFRAGPIFGGYYHRYILPVLPGLIALSMIGFNQLFPASIALTPNPSPPGRGERSAGRIAVIAGFILLLGYPLYFASRDMPYHREVYGQESRLNVAVRFPAAAWLKANTPTDAKVLLGYTGLGVVGGFADRYVLDMGALINPDIFPYYRDVPALGKEHWRRTLRYIQDRKIDYFVTMPVFKDDPASDPVGTPGFESVMIIESPTVTGRFSKVTIWRINREGLPK